MAMLTPRLAACGSVSVCRSYGLRANTNASLYTVLCGHVDLKAPMLTPAPTECGSVSAYTYTSYGLHVLCVRACVCVRVCVLARACVCVCVDLTTM